MLLKQLPFAALLSAVSAQSLTSLLANTSSVSNLTSLVTANPALVQALSSAQNITILAPNNDAFAKLLSTDAGKAATQDAGLLQAILTYHVLNGTYIASQLTDKAAFVPTLLTNMSYANVTGGQVVKGVKNGDKVNFSSGLLANSSVVQADVNFTGGVIHIIDTVLTLPQRISDTATAANLTAIRGALVSADLVEVIDTTPDLTVFAPNNAAFQAIGSGLANLTKEELVGILGYHVINGTVGYSSGLSNGTSIKTLQGGEITVTIDEKGGVWVNNAKVVVPDVLVANGVVHVIDQVLNPTATSLRPSPSASTGVPAFTGVSSASNVPFTSGQPTPTSSLSGAATSRPASTGAAAPMMTGAVGAAALFGVAAAAVVGY